MADYFPQPRQTTFSFFLLIKFVICFFQTDSTEDETWNIPLTYMKASGSFPNKGRPFKLSHAVTILQQTNNILGETNDLHKHCILMSQGRTNNFPIRRLETSRWTELNYSFRKMYLIPLLKQTFPINSFRKKKMVESPHWNCPNCPINLLHE